MLDAAGVEAPKHGDALIAIDKLDKIGRDKVGEDLVARGIDRAAAETCLAAFEDLGAFERLVSGSEAGRAAAANIAAIRTLADSTPAKGHVQFTPRLARGLSYYTGAIMEIAVPDLAGSLGGGGRYDGLIGMFSRRADSRLRFLARARADPGRDGRAGHVSGRRAARPVRTSS